MIKNNVLPRSCLRSAAAALAIAAAVVSTGLALSPVSTGASLGNASASSGGTGGAPNDSGASNASGAPNPGGPPDGTSGSPGGANGGEVFAARCAVCHGPQAAGIPGSFPSLHEQVVGFSKVPQGRDYLVMVVTTGLMGALKVNGTSYNGVMPAQSGLSEAEVAAVLNYLASDLGKNDLGASALSAAEVGDARARHPDKSAQSTRALRPAADP